MLFYFTNCSQNGKIIMSNSNRKEDCNENKTRYSKKSSQPYVESLARRRHILFL